MGFSLHNNTTIDRRRVARVEKIFINESFTKLSVVWMNRGKVGPEIARDE